MPKLTFANPQGPGSASLTVICKRGESILEAAEEHGARVGHACGGNLACSTCHVWVHKGQGSLPDVTDKEDDIMDRAFGVRSESRLACQATLGDEDVEVEITEESLKAWLDENPDERKKAKSAPTAEAPRP